MDYPVWRRLKIAGTAEVVAADGEASEVEEQLQPLRERIAQREEALQGSGGATRMRTFRFVAVLGKARPIHLLEVPRSGRSSGLPGSPQQG